MKKHMFETAPVRAHAIRVGPARTRHRRDVARWAMERRHPLNRDALAAIVATRDILADGSISARWVVDDVDALLLWGIANWCRARGAELPPAIAPTLDTYIRYLSANKLLSPQSDRPNQLRRAVAEHAAELRQTEDSLNRSGARSSGHPSRGGRAHLAPVLPIG